LATSYVDARGAVKSCLVTSKHFVYTPNVSKGAHGQPVEESAMSIHRPKRVTFRSTGRENAAGGDGQKDAKLPEWAVAMQGKGPKDFKPYAVATTYVPGELVKHAKFGDGVVLSVEPSKIEVLFESGARKLAHGIH
jgi:hypothetical protein